MALADKVIETVQRRPGISDRVQQINGECRHLENCGRIVRQKEGDQPIGNFPVRKAPELKFV